MKNSSYLLPEKKIGRTFVKQLEQSDCGPACLLNIIRYYQGEIELERIRLLSGTRASGTSLLGLHDCAQKMGLKPTGAELTLDFLLGLEKPCILYFDPDRSAASASHFVVCYPQKSITSGNVAPQRVLIGDPAKGLYRLSIHQLTNKWKSRSALVLDVDPAMVPNQYPPVKRWSWLYSEVLKQQAAIIVIGFTGIVAAALGLVSAVFIQQLIDVYLPAGNLYRMLAGWMVLLIMLVLRSGVLFLRQQVIIQFNERLNNSLFDSFISHLFQAHKSWFANRRTGDLVMRMEDTQLIQKNITYFISALTMDILMTLSYLSLILYYSLLTGFFLMALIPLFFLVARLYTRSLHQSQQKVVASQSKAAGFFTDSMQSIADIKSFGRESFFSAISLNLFRQQQVQVQQFGTTASRFLLSYDLLGVLTICSGTLLALYLVFTHELSKGELMGISALLGALIPSIGRLAEVNFRIQEAKVAYRRFQECLAIKEEQSLPALQKIPDLRSLVFKEVSFAFTGRKQILRKLSFSIHFGEITLICGTNGSGKSSILNLIEKFYTPTEGSIELNDSLNLQKICSSSWRKYIATVPQDTILFNASLYDNICFGMDSNPEAVNQFCKLYGFDRYFSQFPNGYFTQLGAEGIKLSGGQKQLVCLARALFRRPSLLLLDEPTTAMDKETEQFVIALLEKLKPFMAIVWVTHHPFALNGAFNLLNLDKQDPYLSAQ